MKKIKVAIAFSVISILCIFNLALAAQDEKYIFAILEIKESEIQLLDVAIVDNKVRVDREAVLEDYSYKVKGYDLEEISSGKILKYVNNPLGVSNGIYMLDLIHSKRIKEIDIVNTEDQQLVLNINLEKFVNCGDGKCGKDENYLKCRIDCPAGSWDGYCDQIRDELCDVDCLKTEPYNDADCNEGEIIKNKKEYDEFVKDLIDNKKKKGEEISTSKTNYKETDKLVFIIIGLIILGVVMVFGSVIFLIKNRK